MSAASNASSDCIHVVTLACKDGDTDSCLTPPQVAAAKSIYAPTVNPKTGKEIYPSMQPGSEMRWDALAGPQRPRNLDTLVIDQHASRLDGLLRQPPGLEEARGPQPLVETDRLKVVYGRVTLRSPHGPEPLLGIGAALHRVEQIRLF